MTGKKTRFLSIDQIGSSIDLVTDLAARQDVRIALAGGAALQLYGSDRFTKDVDFVASALLDGLIVVAPLGFGGAQCMTNDGVPVDLIVRDDDYAGLYDAALLAAIRVEDVPVPVISADFMVALKLAAGRDKDLLDLKFLLLESTDVNYESARSIVRQHLGVFAANELDRYLADFQWTKERDNPSRRRRR
jgi:hypothetical protein